MENILIELRIPERKCLDWRWLWEWGRLECLVCLIGWASWADLYILTHARWKRDGWNCFKKHTKERARRVGGSFHNIAGAVSAPGPDPTENKLHGHVPWNSVGKRYSIPVSTLVLQLLLDGRLIRGAGKPFESSGFRPCMQTKIGDHPFSKAPNSANVLGKRWNRQRESLKAHHHYHQVWLTVGAPVTMAHPVYASSAQFRLWNLYCDEDADDIDAGTASTNSKCGRPIESILTFVLSFSVRRNHAGPSVQIQLDK